MAQVDGTDDGLVDQDLFSSISPFLANEKKIRLFTGCGAVVSTPIAHDSPLLRPFLHLKIDRCQFSVINYFNFSVIFLAARINERTEETIRSCYRYDRNGTVGAISRPNTTTIFVFRVSRKIKFTI